MVQHAAVGCGILLHVCVCVCMCVCMGVCVCVCMCTKVECSQSLQDLGEGRAATAAEGISKGVLTMCMAGTDKEFHEL